MAKKSAAPKDPSQKKPAKTAAEKLAHLTAQIKKLERDQRLESSGAPEEVVKLVKRHAFLSDQLASVTDKLREAGFAVDGTKL